MRQYPEGKEGFQGSLRNGLREGASLPLAVQAETYGFSLGSLPFEKIYLVLIEGYLLYSFVAGFGHAST